MNELIVRPEIRSVADIRGKTLVVDAPNTAYACSRRRVLKDAGLIDGRDYALKPIGGSRSVSRPWKKERRQRRRDAQPSILVRRKRQRAEEPRARDRYPGAVSGGGRVRDAPWAARERAVARALHRRVHRIGAHDHGPGEIRSQVVSLIATRLKQDAKVAERTYQALMERASTGAGREIRHGGFKAVLALRARSKGSGAAKPPAPDKYIDLGYYERAMKLLERR